MSPAEELRQAAARLRETAANATPGPWHRRAGNRVSSNVHAREDVVIDGGGWTDGVHTVVYGAALNADADWIALASPVLAEPLAVILDQAAETYEWLVDRTVLPKHALPFVETHVAVARAILQGGDADAS